MMKTEVHRLEDNKLRLDVEVPADELEQAMDAVMTLMARDLKMPGFRPGKVPPQMVLARMGREAVIGEAVNRFIGNWYVSAVSASGIRPVSEPDIDLGTLPAEGEALTFSAAVEVAPKPTLPDIATLTADKPRVPDLTSLVDEVVDATLEGIGELVDTGAPAAEGDEVIVDFTCSVDCTEVTGAAARGYEARLGGGRLLEELEQAIIGTTAGTTLEVPVTFGADHPMPDLAGKDAIFSLNLREVRRLNVPKLTDANVAQVSEFSKAADLRADIEAGIRSRLDDEADSVFRSNAVGALVDASDVTVPPVMVEARKNEIFQAMRSQLESAGTTLESYLAATGQDFDALGEQLQERADQDARHELCLLALAEDAEISVTSTDLHDEIRKHAIDAGDDPDLAVENVEASGRAEILAGELLLQRTVDYLVGKVTPNLVDPPVPGAEDGSAEGDGDTAAEGSTDTAGNTSGETGEGAEHPES